MHANFVALFKHEAIPIEKDSDSVEQAVELETQRIWKD